MERVLFAPRALPPLPPDVAEDPGPFSEWVQRREAERAAAHVSRPAASSLRLVMPMAGEAPPSLVPSLQSLNRQTVTSWTLTVVLERAWHNSFTAALSVSGLLRSATRVQVEPRQDGEGLQSLLTHGLALNEGNDVAVIFPGDVWAPDTVAQLASGLVPDGVVYADEDVVGPDGAHEAPVLKPAHSPELLLGCSSVGRPLALGREVLHAVLRTEGTVSGDIEHDLALRATEVARHVEHIAEVLCHRLVPAGPSDDAGPVMAALRRRKESGAVEPGPARGTFSIRRAADVDGTASLIIPFRDEPALLRACVDSVESTRQGQRCELVLVDNGSVQPETATLLERLEQRAHIRIVRDERPFNWAELSNAGARLAGGDVLVFMNNDIEARRPGWLGALCAQAQRADVGAV
ncbi:MAG TPA: glycosyltransferase, partial [Acidimicrobiales bacterium]|nr:glycosyltransferase [Acidimicrobiales bacterium]